MRKENDCRGLRAVVAYGVTKFTLELHIRSFAQDMTIEARYSFAEGVALLRKSWVVPRNDKALSSHVLDERAFYFYMSRKNGGRKDEKFNERKTQPNRAGSKACS